MVEDPEIYRVSWEDDHKDYADFGNFPSAAKFRDKLKNSISLKRLEFEFQQKDLRLKKVI